MHSSISVGLNRSPFIADLVHKQLTVLTCKLVSVWHQSTARAIREQMNLMLSNDSRGTLMSHWPYCAAPLKVERAWYLHPTKRTSAPFPLHYIILKMHFLFILIYILWSNERCPWHNSLRTEAELTLTDPRFNSWVYVLFIWINFVAVHRHKLMTLTMAVIFIQ